MRVCLSIDSKDALFLKRACIGSGRLAIEIGVYEFMTLAVDLGPIDFYWNESYVFKNASNFAAECSNVCNEDLSLPLPNDVY